MTKNPETNVVEEVQQTHYYPFGGIIADISWGREVQKRLFNGKELDTSNSLYWYDYGARQYDATRCQFTGPDPLTEKYFPWNAWMYCGGDPVNRFDPDGRDWYQNKETLYYTWFDGDGERDGYTYIGGKGSFLDEFESKINEILIKSYNKNGLYSNGLTIEIACPEKGAIIPSDLNKMNDFLDEFVFGYGPDISILKDDHPYTKALQTDDRVVWGQKQLREGQTTTPGQITNVGKHWTIVDMLTTLSIAKQFVGSYSYCAFTAKDKNHLLNIIYDTKNTRSLFYHIPGTGYLNHSRNSIFKPLATTYQFYIWKSIK